MMKKFYLPGLLLVVLVLGAFKLYENDIKIVGNYLLREADKLGETRCGDLIKKKNYLAAYQQLYNDNRGQLADNSEALRRTYKKLKNCQMNTTSTEGGGGSANIKGYEMPAYMLATFYMNDNAKKEFLKNLPKEMQEEYLKAFEEFQNSAPDVYQSVTNSTDKIKAEDSKDYFDWYFKSNQNELLKEFDKRDLQELQQDLENKTLQFNE